MNSDKHRPAGASGNAMIYILLALALLGALTMVLARGSGSGEDNLSAERAELATTRITAYAGSAKNVIDQMMMSGSAASDLDFIKPNHVSFDAGVDIHKVYHPAGGGLSFPEVTPDIFITATDAPVPGWYFSDELNVEWTPTAADDLVLVAYRINRDVCAKINQKITGSADIPDLGGGLAAVFLSAADGGGGVDLDTTVTSCPECEGYPSMCVSNNTGNGFAYYNIISAQ